MREYSFNIGRYFILRELIKPNRQHKRRWDTVIATIPIAVGTTFFDVLKTRTMTQPLYYSDNAWKQLRNLLANESPFMLFRAAGIRALHLSIMVSVFNIAQTKLLNPVGKTRKVLDKKRPDPFSKLE
jgi:hypothetical protein